jgi:hypothetical protein
MRNIDTVTMEQQSLAIQSIGLFENDAIPTKNTWKKKQINEPPCLIYPELASYYCYNRFNDRELIYKEFESCKGNVNIGVILRTKELYLIGRGINK